MPAASALLSPSPERAKSLPQGLAEVSTRQGGSVSPLGLPQASPLQERHEEEVPKPRTKNLASWSEKTKKGGIERSWKGGANNSAAYPFMSSHEVVTPAYRALLPAPDAVLCALHG